MRHSFITWCLARRVDLRSVSIDDVKRFWQYVLGVYQGDDGALVGASTRLARVCLRAKGDKHRPALELWKLSSFLIQQKAPRNNSCSCKLLRTPGALLFSCGSERRNGSLASHPILDYPFSKRSQSSVHCTLAANPKPLNPKPSNPKP